MSHLNLEDVVEVAKDVGSATFVALVSSRTSCSALDHREVHAAVG
jgi:hypothetical protein